MSVRLLKEEKKGVANRRLYVIRPRDNPALPSPATPLWRVGDVPSLSANSAPQYEKSPLCAQSGPGRNGRITTLF